jgi:hypothetical protein
LPAFEKVSSAKSVSVTGYLATAALSSSHPEIYLFPVTNFKFDEVYLASF